MRKCSFYPISKYSNGCINELDLPVLKKIELQSSVFKGKQVETISIEPFNYGTLLVMESLPVLECIKTDLFFNFIFMGRVIIRSFYFVLFVIRGK